MSPERRRGLLAPEEYTDGVLRGDRALIGRTITLVESTQPQHQERAQEVLALLLPHSGSAYRIGITGVPGVGKSTFIDAFGSNLTGDGHRVAVLAVDPSSARTGGSILGDKTRMERLAADESAFIRPAPTSGTLGGVARATRESMVVVEAAGFGVVIVETVGVGQSETVVAGMVDIFCVLMLPGAGDELQGIKKGILELADIVAVNKAEGDNALRAREAAANYANALRLVTPSNALWQPPVLMCSGLRNEGLDVIWAEMERYRALRQGDRSWERNREEQQLRWLWEMVEERLLTRVRTHPRVVAELAGIESGVRSGAVTPTMACAQILAALDCQ